MKNLLIYINPSEDFGIEEKITAKIQVEKAYQTTVSLPFYDTMTEREVNKVIDVVKKYENLIKVF